MVMEAREDRKKAQETFKQAVLSANPEKYLPLLYPDMLKERVDAESLSDQDLMEGTGEWEMPDEMDPEEAAQLLEKMIHGGSTGSMTMTDVERFE